MAEEGGGNGGTFDLGNELTCTICTDILYQPLALLDCLHSFCGSCLKEWFAWQATSASKNRRTTHPYTCPSCRDSVRGTKADWRLTTMLEGYLKANPDRVKSDEEKEEMRMHYTPGEDVLPPIPSASDGGDGEDERLLAQVREMSMANIGTETATRRAERTDRRRRRQEDVHRTGTDESVRGHLPGRREPQPASLTETRMREHDAQEPQIEHQPSLRSLLSASDADSHDMQTEILQSIYAEGLLDGIDVDNLTPEQEEALTERIAEVYRRRQRHRDRSRNREPRHREERSLRPPSAGTDLEAGRARGDSASTQVQSTRPRPPISRPHLFEQNTQDTSRSHRRSVSATGQRSNHSTNRLGDPSTAAPATAARSATDLSQTSSPADAPRNARRRLSGNGRSATNPEEGNMRDQEHRVRANTGNSMTDVHTRRPHSSSNSLSLESTRRQTGPTNNSASLTASPLPSPASTQHFVRPAVSNSAFAPEPVTSPVVQAAPSIKCNRCEKSDIQFDLHYNCRSCLDGHFNICLRCYRDGQGCNHWFGFGYRAFDRWHRAVASAGFPPGYERAHILMPRRYIRAQTPQSQLQSSHGDEHSSPQIQEGGFCEQCFTFADGCYWYCSICLDGAWGFCDSCVQQGKHCTHPLLPVAHISSQHWSQHDPAKRSFVPLPHLRPDSYVPLPVPKVCDICTRPVSPNSTRFHCYRCNNGNYEICNECYHGLVAQGKISQANGPQGWRRCLQGHRMAVIGYQDTAEGGHIRITVREPVGGWAFKEDSISLSSQLPAGGLPPDGGVGTRCLAIYNYFPKEGVTDELAFPKNAEIREVGKENDDWFWGAYASAVNLFPSNHVRML